VPSSISWKQSLLIFIYLNGLVNLPLWIIGYFSFTNRAFISYEGILTIFAGIHSKILGIILLLFTWFADVIVSQSLTFQFTSPTDFLKSTKYLDQIDWLNLISIQITVLALIFLVFLFLFIKKVTVNLKRYYLSFLFFSVMLLLIDAINGTSEIIRKDSMVIPANIVGSPGHILIKSMELSSAKSASSINKFQGVFEREFDIVNWARKNPDRYILFLIVESLGVPMFDEGHLFLQSLVQSPTHNITYIETEFKGATTNAELALLCGIRGSFRQLQSEHTKNCLPNKLKEIGWNSLGFHGFTDKMFDRNLWWPKLGLSEIFFLNSSNTLMTDLERCGNVFKGACDESVLDFALKSHSSPKTFIYILTLNTHLPVVPTYIPNNIEKICIKNDLSNTSCQHFTSLSKIFKKIKNIITEHGAYSSSPLPLVIVVGDHAPPFHSTKDRNDYHPSKVPVYILQPIK
jgi:hypothetical protein